MPSGGSDNIAWYLGCGGLGTEVGAVSQPELDLRVHDRVAMDEIELYAEVLSAVAQADQPLTVHELDVVLGVTPPATSQELLAQD